MEEGINGQCKKEWIKLGHGNAFVVSVDNFDGQQCLKCHEKISAHFDEQRMSFKQKSFRYYGICECNEIDSEISFCLPLNAVKKCFTRSFSLAFRFVSFSHRLQSMQNTAIENALKPNGFEHISRNALMIFIVYYLPNHWNINVWGSSIP